MKKLLVLISALALVMALGLVAGCGENGETADTEAAAEATPEATIAAHDCDGGCGMKAMDPDKVTEIDGKFYCAGCATKVKEAMESHEGHDHGEGGHGDG